MQTTNRKSKTYHMRSISFPKESTFDNEFSSAEEAFSIFTGESGWTSCESTAASTTVSNTPPQSPGVDNKKDELLTVLRKKNGGSLVSTHSPFKSKARIGRLGGKQQRGLNHDSNYSKGSQQRGLTHDSNHSKGSQERRERRLQRRAARKEVEMAAKVEAALQEVKSLKAKLEREQTRTRRLAQQLEREREARLEAEQALLKNLEDSDDSSSVCSDVSDEGSVCSIHSTRSLQSVKRFVSSVCHKSLLTLTSKPSVVKALPASRKDRAL